MQTITHNRTQSSIIKSSYLLAQKNFGYFKLSVSKTFKICNLQKEWFCFRYHHWRWIMYINFTFVCYYYEHLTGKDSVYSGCDILIVGGINRNRAVHGDRYSFYIIFSREASLLLTLLVRLYVCLYNSVSYSNVLEERRDFLSS